MSTEDYSPMNYNTLFNDFHKEKPQLKEDQNSINLLTTRLNQCIDNLIEEESKRFAPESEEMEYDEDNYFDPSDSLFGSEALETDQLLNESQKRTSVND